MNYRLNSKRMDCIFEKKKKETHVHHSKIKFSKTTSINTAASITWEPSYITFSFHEPHSTSIVKQKLERERLHVNRNDHFSSITSKIVASLDNHHMKNKIKL